MSLVVQIANRQRLLPIDRRRLRAAVRQVLRGEGARDAQISVAVVADEEMQSLNARYLGHDYPTDVLSFSLEQSPELLEGEVVVNAQQAIAAANRAGWPAASELTLYVIHGLLHLLGYDDQDKVRRGRMRRREEAYLAALGLGPPF